MSNSKKIVLGILILIIIGAGIWYKIRAKTIPISTEQPAGSENQNLEPRSGGTMQLFIYTQGNIKADVIDLIIKENNVTPVKMIDMSTGKETYGPSVYYTADIKLKVQSVNGIDPKYLQAGSEISMHYGWEATKPNFSKSDTIETEVELVGTYPQYDPSNGYWRFKENKNLWTR